MGAGKRLLAFTTACNGENSLAPIGGKRSSRAAARVRGIGGQGLEWDWHLYTMKIHIFIRRSNNNMECLSHYNSDFYAIVCFPDAAKQGLI